MPVIVCQKIGIPSDLQELPSVWPKNVRADSGLGYGFLAHHVKPGNVLGRHRPYCDVRICCFLVGRSSLDLHIRPGGGQLEMGRGKLRNKCVVVTGIGHI